MWHLSGITLECNDIEECSAAANQPVGYQPETLQSNLYTVYKSIFTEKLNIFNTR